MAQAALQDKEFVFLWSLKVSEVLKSPHYDDGFLFSPIFHTSHNGFGFDWRLGVASGDDEGQFYVYPFQFVSQPRKSPIVRWSISVDDKAEHEYAVGDFEPFSYNLQDSSWYNYQELQRDQIDEYAVDGVMTFHFRLKIAEQEFAGSGIKSFGDLGEQPEMPGHDFPSCNIFEKILVEEKVQDEDPKKPEADIHQKVLDFQIQTGDGYVIWCHQVALVSGNEKFATLIGSGLKESEQSKLKVKFGSDTMMEVLHTIYRGAVSPKFQKLYLDEVLDAANDYDLPKLKLACEKQLLEQCTELDGESGARILMLCHRYGMAEVKRKALKWARENLAEILKSDAGKDLKGDLLVEIAEASDAKHRGMNE